MAGARTCKGDNRTSGGRPKKGMCRGGAYILWSLSSLLNTMKGLYNKQCSTVLLLSLDNNFQCQSCLGTCDKYGLLDPPPPVPSESIEQA